MDLLEHEGKALFRRHGIAVPAGALWPARPAGVERVVVKAQVPAGKRGKQGGVRFADGAELDATARAVAALHLGGHAVESVLVEERLDIAAELYLAVAVDRDARCHVVLASPAGGMDIEGVPAGRILRLPVDPLLGLRAFMVARILRFLGATRENQAALASTVRALYDLALAEDAELAEINPLAVTRGGRVVAADAKVRLDRHARYRHPEWDMTRLAHGGSMIERMFGATGAVAAEIDPAGDVVGVISGAGLMMATLDLLVHLGVRVRCIVDMGGAPLLGEKGLDPIFAAAAQLAPRVMLINACFMTARADQLARALAAIHARTPFRARVVVRLAGHMAAEGRALLAPLGFDVHDDLEEALRAVVDLARAAR
jgi:succinyl-CoA synthetase beta subunit